MTRPHSRTRLVVSPLEGRTVPTITAAGFNDALGMNANSTGNSPYQIGGDLAAQGAAEPGWAEAWQQRHGTPDGEVIASDVVFEGDGSLHIIGPSTTGVHRGFSDGVTAGVVTVSQWMYIPDGGGIAQYLTDEANDDAATTTAAQWTAGAGNNFQIVDAGVWENTGIPVPVQQWFRVDVRVDMTARTFDFFVNGVHYQSPDPLDFRGNPPVLNNVDYFVEGAAGGYVDALQVSTSDIPTGDQYFATKNTQLVVNAPGVLANDLITGSSPQAVLVSPPNAFSQFNLNPNGSFSYTPTAGFTGLDWFRYRIVDDGITSSTVTVALTVSDGSGGAPFARDDTYAVPINSPMTVAAAKGVLANDSSPNGNALQAVLVSPPAVGTLTLHADGSFAFAFPPDFLGDTTFVYKATDGTIDSNTATVTLTRQNLVQVDGGNLDVFGTAGNDVLRLTPVGVAIQVEMHTPLGDVSQLVTPPSGVPLFVLVRVDLGSGDDRLKAPTLTIPLWVTGGDGDKSVQTGAGRDLVILGNDNNTIVTGGGNDTVTAGDGQNDIETGFGNDSVLCGTGGSFVDAGAGNDYVRVTGGSNWVKGGIGNDILIGGNGSDRLEGGMGNDLLVGGLGADQLLGQAGNDLLFDGTVALANPNSDSLRAILAAYNPASRQALVRISSRLVVTPDNASADSLTGGAGTDWFWSSGSLDMLDRQPTEPHNAMS